MNYLAHLFFADDTPESIIGNLAGDHFKGAVERHPDPLQSALRLHRAVDEFTDTHPAVGESRRRLESQFRHFTRVIIDVFYDHFLAISWGRYASEPFVAMRDRVYAALHRDMTLLPAGQRDRFRRMTEDDWLSSYRNPEGIRRSLFHLSRRIHRPVELDIAVDRMIGEHDDFAGDFHRFFPDLIAHVDAWKRIRS